MPDTRAKMTVRKRSKATDPRQPSRNLRALGFALLMAAAGSGSGCALSAAAVLPVAVGGAPVVVDSLGVGSTDTFWVARFDDVVEAALRARTKLSLKLDDARIEDDEAVLRFADQWDEQIILRIDRRTETVTRVRFVTPTSAVRGLARLLGRQIIDELQDADAFLVEWAAEERMPRPQ